MGFRNVYIYVSDALRYDHVPESVAEEGKVIPTLTPGAYTPICFSSMLTGRDPQNHNVRSFYDTVNEKTVFDLFDNHCYYDHPEDAMSRNVFGNYNTAEELEEMEEPFFYVERSLDTHEPYGEVKHGNEVPSERYIDGTLEERYMEGVKSTVDHFWSHVEKLKELGLYENTLIIFTSDHGELLGEKKVFRSRKGHNKPMCRELNVVPTVLINHEAEFDKARTIDLVPTALSILDREKSLETDGKDLTTKVVSTGVSMLQINTRPLLTASCKWKWTEQVWTPTASKIKTDLSTLLIDLINPLRIRVRNSKIADFVRPENSDNSQALPQKENKEELEDLDF